MTSKSEVSCSEFNKFGNALQQIASHKQDTELEEMIKQIKALLAKEADAGKLKTTILFKAQPEFWLPYKHHYDLDAGFGIKDYYEKIKKIFIKENIKVNKSIVNIKFRGETKKAILITFCWG
jgi:hypothetical protein